MAFELKPDIDDARKRASAKFLEQFRCALFCVTSALHGQGARVKLKRLEAQPCAVQAFCRRPRNGMHILCRTKYLS